MKKRNMILAWLLILTMLLGLVGCGEDDTPTTTPTTTEATTAPTTEPPGPDMSAYDEAIAFLGGANNLMLTIETERDMTVGGEVYENNSQYEISWQGLTGDSPIATVKETWIYCGEKTDVVYTYAEGNTYLELDGGKFTAPATTEDFIDLIYPTVLLDASLYQTITTEELDKSTVYTFADPTAAESWLGIEEDALISAQGTATVSGGHITEFTYAISYTSGVTTNDYTITTAVTEFEPVLELTAPAAPEDYLVVEDIIAPLVLNMGYTAMNHGQSKTVTVGNEIVFGAAGTYIQLTEAFDTYGQNKDFVYKSTYDYTYMDLSSNKVTETYNYEESYYDSTYTYLSSEDDEPYTLSGDQLAIGLLSDAVGAEITDFAVSIDTIDSITMNYAAGCVLIEFTGNADAGLAMEDAVSLICMGDEDGIDDLADGYETVMLEGYLAVDVYTMLPTSYGITYSGTHLFGSQMPTLALVHTAAIHMPNAAGAYETITGEELPAEEPEEKPTPVFYKVTDAEGHTMWLLGTIHIGDNRTEYLPQEIYDALDAADALAVEMDSDDFNEQLENDEDLLMQYVESLYYTDNTTIKDHLDETVYEDAVRGLKAAGYYNSTSEMMKPTMWYQLLTEFYLQQWQTLSYDNGVDNMLMARAREQEKEILNVESPIEHNTLLFNFSDALQEFLLMSTLYSDPASYGTGSDELFEMWCRGDEAELMAYFADSEAEEDEAVIEELTEEERAEMTEEELAIYDRLVTLYEQVAEEYETALMTERNIDMLEVAKGYLESGDTVFYAVGLAHLLGSDGLVETLRQAGYTVELVTFAQ